MAENAQGYDMMGPPVVIKGGFRRRRAVQQIDTLEGGVSVPIQPPSGLTSPRSRAIMFSLLSALGGVAVAGALLIFMVMFSLWGSKVDVWFAIWAGIVVGGLGVALAVLQYLPWRKPIKLTISPDVVTVHSPAFRTPFVIPRSAVRVVDFDPRPRSGLTDVKRFPISGGVPEEVRADQLDRYPSSPWEPKPDSPVPSDPMAPENLWKDARPPEPHEPGWAAYHPTGRPSAPPRPPAELAYLYTGDGSALPVLRFNVIDLPNVALLFDRELMTPSAPPAFLLTGNVGSSMLVHRPVRGLLLRVTDPETAESAFQGWGSVRQITSTDVLEEGLRPPKPVKGWRAVAYVAAMVVPLILGQIMRARRHRFGYQHHGFGYWVVMTLASAAILGLVVYAYHRKWQREARTSVPGRFARRKL